jgi:hypothetical protein
MRGGAVLLIFAAGGLGWFVGAGHQSPTQSTSPAPIYRPVNFYESPADAKALTTAPNQAPASQAKQAPGASPPAAANPKAAAEPPDKTKRTIEKVLTAAAIAALIIEASRAAYHSSGRPCACPDDRMRNGRACGGRSAYSRPGGAAPLCYPQDITAVMIERYRSTVASR